MATITDIAKVANVSISTVSRVLNYDPTYPLQRKPSEKFLKQQKP